VAGAARLADRAGRLQRRTLVAAFGGLIYPLLRGFVAPNLFGFEVSTKAVVVSRALIPTRRETQPGSQESQRSDQLLRGRTGCRCSQGVWRDLTDART